MTQPQKNSVLRSPVIVVLGHVDHGKTTLLDAIRKSEVAAGEAGGITQSIGAYEIIHHPNGSPMAHSGRIPEPGIRMTFIDTPGHEAFSKMRARGVKVADFAILVVAIDDGVELQTKEAIQILNETKLPFVVVLTKADKQGIDQNRVKNELTAAGVLLEGYGGNVSVQVISGKTGEGVPELLDLLLLAIDLADLSCDPHAPAEGVVIEAKLDQRRGILVTAIPKNGTLRVGDGLAAGSAVGKVKGLEDFMGKRIEEVMPSTPVLIFGFESLPEIGSVFSTRPEAILEARTNKAVAPASRREAILGVQKKENQVNVILKGDASGSLEALSQIIDNVPKPAGVTLKVVSREVGDISDGDVKYAIATSALIIGFKVASTKPARQLAEIHSISLIASEIIYDLVKALEEEFRRLDRTIVKGDLEILALFSKKGTTRQVIGGRVVLGEILNNVALDVEQRGVRVGTAKIMNLQKDKKDAESVPAGNECGLLIDSVVVVRVGDHLVIR